MSDYSPVFDFQVDQVNKLYTTIGERDATIAEMRKAIAIYCREEAGFIDFSCDDEAIEFFTKEYSDD
ncbi:MAG: hypothetical protein DRQ40_08185 [Gammaproteobacteria bacterium]|nr:MAG: hypothetical protein DRQ40_08185 [Gammaproteobacteria bacterium]